jgi:hypothetical protein
LFDSVAGVACAKVGNKLYAGTTSTVVTTAWGTVFSSSFSNQFA